MITDKQSESTYFQYQKALALVLSAAQHCTFKEEDSHEAERGYSGICASAVAVCIRRWALFRVHLTYCTDVMTELSAARQMTLWNWSVSCL